MELLYNNDLQGVCMYEEYFKNFYDLLSKGYLFPRWANNLNAGYGSPILIILPPLKYYLGSIIQTVFKIPVPIILKMLSFNLNWLVWPLSLLSLDGYRKKAGWQRFLVSSLAISCLVLANKPEQLVYVLSIVVLFSSYSAFKTKQRLKMAKKYLLIILTAMGLSVFYWLPAITEYKQVKAFMANNNLLFEDLEAQSLDVVSDSSKVEMINEYDSRYLWYGYELIASGSADFRFNVYDYPGWKVFFQSQPINIDPGDDENKGLITFTLPDIKHRADFLEIVFEDTKTRALAENITYLTMALLIIYTGCGYFKKNN